MASTRRRQLLAILIGGAVVWSGLGLPAQERSLLADLGTASFDVASIRPSRASQPSLGVGVPGRFDATGVTLMRLIQAAFGGTSGSLPASRIVLSPGAAALKWIDSDRWDIVAGLPDGINGIEPSLKMLQTLLRDRFQLRLHTEQRSLPLYALIARGERRGLHRSDVDCEARLANEARASGSPACGWQFERGAVVTIHATGVTLGEMAHRLSSNPAVGRVVEDRTNLPGPWDFEFSYEASATLSSDPSTPPPPASAPSIFTALEALGLKLEPSRGPVDVLVIDGAQKPSND
jgi:uncharacterized protein (TIGR03435 family)